MPVFLVVFFLSFIKASKLLPKLLTNIGGVGRRERRKGKRRNRRKKKLAKTLTFVDLTACMHMDFVDFIKGSECSQS